MSNQIKSNQYKQTLPELFTAERKRKQEQQNIQYETLWNHQGNIYTLTCLFGGTWEGVTVLCGWLGWICLWGGLPCWSCAWEQGENVLNLNIISVINNISATFRNQFLASIFNDFHFISAASFYRTKSLWAELKDILPFWSLFSNLHNPMKHPGLVHQTRSKLQDHKINVDLQILQLSWWFNWHLVTCQGGWESGGLQIYRGRKVIWFI